VFTPQYGHLGDYESFEDARAESGGYQDDAILRVTAENTRRISGVSLSTVDAHMLAALRQVLPDRPARILDFGGALGGHYFSMPRFIGDRIERWTVVELPRTAALGNSEFADGRLSFGDMEEADIAIASGSVQYTPDPCGALARLRERAPHLILDKAPVHPIPRWTVQRIDPRLFGVEVSFPAYFFGEEEFRDLTGAPLIEWDMPEYQALLDGERAAVYHGALIGCRR